MSVSTREAIVALRAIRDGAMHPIEGCRRVVSSLSGWRTELRSHPAMMTIAAIESETDDYPLGAARDHWSSAALARVDAKMAVYVEQVRESLSEACDALEQLLSSDQDV